MHHELIANVFNGCFEVGERACLVAGAAEPFYEPATAASYARLHYREDFAASALHEAAHWCLAGASRRTKLDFGYDYVPPPRSFAQQLKFYDAELKVQSLEQLFAESLGMEFCPSADNLLANLEGFRRRLECQRATTLTWVHNSSDRRAFRFLRALAQSGPDQIVSANG